VFLGSVQVAHALCISKIQYGENGEVISAKDGEGEEITGELLEAVKKAYANDEKGGFSGSGTIETLRRAIVDILLVDPSRSRDAGDGTRVGSGMCTIDHGCHSPYSYLNNIDAVRANQNKMKVNAATQAVAIGKRATALSTEAEREVAALGQQIQSQDDVVGMLKGVAALQAQHLQKTSVVTAMRAKLMEMNAIDDIIEGDIFAKTIPAEETTSEDSEEK
jgi:hypothetical protein